VVRRITSVPAVGKDTTPVNDTSDLLVSYPRRHFRRARREIIRRLGECGDPQPRVEKTKVPGIAVVHTRTNGREVIRKCRELFEAGESFEFVVKWVPVDLWCETSLDAMKTVIEQRIRERIEQGQTWAMKVEKRGWRQYHAREIIDHLASSIDRKVDLGHPDRIVRIDVLGPVTAVSLLGPDEIFSIRAPRLRARSRENR
jgi:tRNA(Ser,Leu) C12 N-acetylase TAN1